MLSNSPTLEPLLVLKQKARDISNTRHNQLSKFSRILFFKALFSGCTYHNLGAFHILEFKLSFPFIMGWKKNEFFTNSDFKDNINLPNSYG